MGWAWRVELDVLCCCRLSYGNWHKVHKTGTMGLYSNGSFCGDATCVSGSRDDAHGPWSLPKLWRRGQGDLGWIERVEDLLQCTSP